MLDAKERRVLRAAWFIEAHLFDRLRAEDVSTAVGGSTSELQRMFRQVYGTSLMAYQRQRRLSVGASWLPSASVGEVAMRCGYGSSRAFVRAFTRRYGVSPGRYRSNAVEGFFGASPANEERLRHRARVDRVPAYERRPASLRLFGFRYGVDAADDASFQQAILRLRRYVVPGEWVFGALVQDSHGMAIFMGTPSIDLPDSHVVKAGAIAVFHHRGPFRMVRETISALVEPWRTALVVDEHRLPFERFVMPGPEDTSLCVEFCLPVKPGPNDES